MGGRWWGEGDGGGRRKVRLTVARKAPLTENEMTRRKSNTLQHETQLVPCGARVK